MVLPEIYLRARTLPAMSYQPKKIRRAQMAEKITYLTPTGIISDTFREEFPRAKRWSDKLFANRREYQDKQAEMVEQSAQLRISRGSNLYFASG